jgi:hypothetical protein
MNIIVREAVPDDAGAPAYVIVTATQKAFLGLVPGTCLTWLTENEKALLHEQALADREHPGRGFGRCGGSPERPELAREFEPRT